MLSKSTKELFADREWRHEVLLALLDALRQALDHDFEWVCAVLKGLAPLEHDNTKSFIAVLWSAPLITWAHERCAARKPPNAGAGDNSDYEDSEDLAVLRGTNYFGSSKKMEDYRMETLKENEKSLEWFAAGRGKVEASLEAWPSAFEIDYSLLIHSVVFRHLARSMPFDEAPKEAASFCAKQFGRVGALLKMLEIIEASHRVIEETSPKVRPQSEVVTALDDYLKRHLNAIEQSLTTRRPSKQSRVVVSEYSGNEKFDTLGELDLCELGVTLQHGGEGNSDSSQTVRLTLYTHAARPISEVKMSQYAEQLERVFPRAAQIVCDFCDGQYHRSKLTEDSESFHAESLRELWGCLLRHGVVRLLPIGEGLADVKTELNKGNNFADLLLADRTSIPSRKVRWREYRGSLNKRIDTLENRIASACHYLFESYSASTASFQLVGAIFACEAIFGKNDTELSKSISEMAAVALEPNLDFRVEAILAVKTLYDLRSRVVHGTEVGLTDVDVHVARTVAVGALLQAIAFRQQFVRLHRNEASNATDEMFRELEHCKIRGESPTGALSWPSVRRIWMTREQYSELCRRRQVDQPEE